MTVIVLDKPSQLPIVLKRILDNIKRNSVNGFDALAYEVTLDIFGKTIEDTPVGIDDKEEITGALKGSWSVGQGHIPMKIVRKNPRRTRDSIRDVIYRKMGTDQIPMFMINPLPYAGNVEFGGYPDPPKLGTWHAKQQKFIKRSAGGFSKQAPVGMLRRNAFRFKHVVAAQERKRFVRLLSDR